MLVILLYVFVWLIGTIICIIFMVRFLCFWRKCNRELKERYPEVLAQRKKDFLWPFTPYIIFIIPNENDMLDKETFALQRKAWFSFICMFLTLGLLLIFSFLLHLILGWRQSLLNLFWSPACAGMTKGRKGLGIEDILGHFRFVAEDFSEVEGKELFDFLYCFFLSTGEKF